jgi:hypothetical protein
MFQSVRTARTLRLNSEDCGSFRHVPRLEYVKTSLGEDVRNENANEDLVAYNQNGFWQ